MARSTDNDENREKEVSTSGPADMSDTEIDEARRHDGNRHYAKNEKEVNQGLWNQFEKYLGNTDANDLYKKMHTLNTPFKSERELYGQLKKLEARNDRTGIKEAIEQFSQQIQARTSSSPNTPLAITPVATAANELSVALKTYQNKTTPLVSQFDTGTTDLRQRLDTWIREKKGTITNDEVMAADTLREQVRLGAIDLLEKVNNLNTLLSKDNQTTPNQNITNNVAAATQLVNDVKNLLTKYDEFRNKYVAELNAEQARLAQEQRTAEERKDAPAPVTAPDAATQGLQTALVQFNQTKVGTNNIPVKTAIDEMGATADRLQKQLADKKKIDVKEIAGLNTAMTALEKPLGDLAKAYNALAKQYLNSRQPAPEILRSTGAILDTANVAFEKADAVNKKFNDATAEAAAAGEAGRPASPSSMLGTLDTRISNFFTPSESAQKRAQEIHEREMREIDLILAKANELETATRKVTAQPADAASAAAPVVSAAQIAAAKEYTKDGHVLEANYGDHSYIIIKSPMVAPGMNPPEVNGPIYTVLGLSVGKEDLANQQREIKAYIAAYAQRGSQIGPIFPKEKEGAALDKAYEMATQDGLTILSGKPVAETTSGATGNKTISTVASATSDNDSVKPVAKDESKGSMRNTSGIGAGDPTAPPPIPKFQPIAHKPKEPDFKLPTNAPNPNYARDSLHIMASSNYKSGDQTYQITVDGVTKTADGTLKAVDMKMLKDGTEIAPTAPEFKKAESDFNGLLPNLAVGQIHYARGKTDVDPTANADVLKKTAVSKVKFDAAAKAAGFEEMKVEVGVIGTADTTGRSGNTPEQNHRMNYAEYAKLRAETGADAYNKAGNSTSVTFVAHDYFYGIDGDRIAGVPLGNEKFPTPVPMHQQEAKKSGSKAKKHASAETSGELSKYLQRRFADGSAANAPSPTSNTSGAQLEAIRQNAVAGLPTSLSLPASPQELMAAGRSPDYNQLRTATTSQSVITTAVLADQPKPSGKALQDGPHEVLSTATAPSVKSADAPPNPVSQQQKQASAQPSPPKNKAAAPAAA